MDSNGARLLRQRLEEQAAGAPLPETAHAGEVVAASAPRIYHWFGIAPPSPAAQVEPAAVARWRRLQAAFARLR